MIHLYNRCKEQFSYYYRTTTEQLANNDGVPDTQQRRGENDVRRIHLHKEGREKK